MSVTVPWGYITECHMTYRDTIIMATTAAKIVFNNNFDS
jgi:hypothetical protein